MISFTGQNRPPKKSGSEYACCSQLSVTVHGLFVSKVFNISVSFGRLEILLVKIGLGGISSVGLFKEALYKNEIIQRTPKLYISPIWGEAPGNPSVAK